MDTESANIKLDTVKMPSLSSRFFFSVILSKFGRLLMVARVVASNRENETQTYIIDRVKSYVFTC